MSNTSVSINTGLSFVNTFSHLGVQCTAIPAKCLDIMLAAEHTGGHDEYFTGSPSSLLPLPAFSPPPFSDPCPTVSLADPLPCGGLQSPLGMPSKHPSQAA